MAEFLHRDGVLVLQYVGFIASDQLVANLVWNLWEEFAQKQKDENMNEEKKDDEKKEEEIELMPIADA